MKYGFHTYGFDARTRRAPLVAPLGDAAPGGLRLAAPAASSLVQAEIETFALEPDGTVAWRIAHSDVVTEAELVGGRLVLTSFGGRGHGARSGRRAARRADAARRRGETPWITAQGPSRNSWTTAVDPVGAAGGSVAVSPEGPSAG